jgi:hypothetical protein
VTKRTRPQRRRPAPGLAPSAPAGAPWRWTRRLLRNGAIALPAVVAVWLLATPFYNTFLRHAAERLVRLAERPPVTRLMPRDRHHLVLARADLRGALRTTRVTDVHFPLVLLALLFLATPGIPTRRRLETLGWALLAAAFFHVVSLAAWVQFVYATQLGSWSAAHYGPASRNLLGLAKHLLDLPLKLALPVVLWAAFHLRSLPIGSLLEDRRHQM